MINTIVTAVLAVESLFNRCKDTHPLPKELLGIVLFGMMLPPLPTHLRLKPLLVDLHIDLPEWST